MNKTVKTLLIIAGAMFLVGALLLGGVLAHINFDYSQLSTTAPAERVEKTYTFAPQDSLRVDSAVGDVRLEPSQDDKIHVIYYDFDNVTYEITEESGAISITRRFTKQNWFGVNLNNQSDALTIQIPSDFAGDINLRATTGDLSLEKLSEVGTLDITATTGQVDCKDIAAEGLSLSTTTGGWRLNGVLVQKTMKLSSQTADISLYNVEAGESITCTSTTGRIEADTLKSALVHLETTTGDIQVNGITADRSEFYATTGTVEGTMPGGQQQYSVKSSSSTGDSNLPKDWQGGARQLDVRTSTGDIHIRFAQ